MGEYHDGYLNSDMVLLADVFEKFRKTRLQHYKLDPCHYFTSPGLRWDDMLKMTQVQLELMTDIDMFQFGEKRMRCGISYIASRHGEANNKYMTVYDSSKSSKYIMYLDANNLHGFAVSQCLPTVGFKWMNKEQIEKVILAACVVDSKKGMIMEVDLENPSHLDKLHNDYPLAAERLKATPDMLSPYCKMIRDKYGISKGKYLSLS